MRHFVFRFIGVKMDSNFIEHPIKPIKDNNYNL